MFVSQIPFMELDSATLTVLKDQHNVLCNEKWLSKRVDYVGQADHLRKGSQHPAIWETKFAVSNKHV